LCIGIEKFEKDVYTNCYCRLMAWFIMEPPRVYTPLYTMFDIEFLIEQEHGRERGGVQIRKKWR
jgi:hypothetical protein